MSAGVFVERAAEISRELTRMRARGPGDTENAMRSIERDYGVDYWTIWRLRYRLSKIKDIGCEVYARLVAAYQSECEQQERLLAHELEIVRALAARKSVVGEVESAMGCEALASSDGRASGENDQA